MRRLSLALAVALASALALGGVLAGCGADYPDLMVLERSGTLPDARLRLLVNDGGTVRCNGGEERQMPPRPMLDARDIVRELREEAMEDLVLPRRPGSLLRFEVRTVDGSVTFSDADAVGRLQLGRLVALTRLIAQDVCGLPR